MKKIITACFIMILIINSSSLFAYSRKRIISFEEYPSNEEIELCINKLKVLYDIPFENNTVKIYGEYENKFKNKFYDEKIIVVKNINNKILDFKIVEFIDNFSTSSFDYNGNSFCLKLKYHDFFTNKFTLEYLYVSDSFPYIHSYPIKNNWVASGLISKDYILYSTEHDVSNLKKINLITGEITHYDSKDPNVKLFRLQDVSNDDENCLAVFEYQNKKYKVYEDEIIESEESLETVPKIVLYNFYCNEKK